MHLYTSATVHSSTQTAFYHTVGTNLVSTKFNVLVRQSTIVEDPPVQVVIAIVHKRVLRATVVESSLVSVQVGGGKDPKNGAFRHGLGWRTRLEGTQMA